MENFESSLTLHNLTAAQIAAVGAALAATPATIAQRVAEQTAATIEHAINPPMAAASDEVEQARIEHAMECLRTGNPDASGLVKDTAEQPKPRRGRKPNNAAAAEPATPPSGDLPLTPAETAPSIDDVRKALSDLLARTDMTKCSQLLAEFGATRISELPADKYAAVVKACAEKQA